MNSFAIGDTKKFKNSQLITLNLDDFVTTGTTSIHVNSLAPIDRIRISIAADVNCPNFTPGLIFYSDLNNNYIGTAACNYSATVGAENLFNEALDPQNGMSIFFPYKVQLTGDYRLSVTDLAGDLPDPLFEGLIIILIEYFIDHV